MEIKVSYCIHPEDGGYMFRRRDYNDLQDTRRHSPEEHNLFHHCRDNVRSPIINTDSAPLQGTKMNLGFLEFMK